MTDHFTISKDDPTIIIAHCRGDIAMDLERAVKELNRLEDGRRSKKAEVAKLRRREERYQGVISGIKDYIDLKYNNDLWWND